MPPTAPPLTLLVTEPMRAVLDYARMRLMPRPTLPRGEPHPVVVIPGLATDERSIAPLVRHCNALGYEAWDWGRGYNLGPQHGDVRRWLDELAGHIGARLEGERRKASLIGWSLGGICAREIAKRLPGRVRMVITLGTPFAGKPQHTNAVWLYRLVNRQTVKLDPRLTRELRTPPPVPVTSIYSRSDGVVAWRACREQPSARAENIEVDCSHFGLVWHPDVLAIVADRLSQSEAEWRPWAMRRAA